jgi:hypothetical protein
VKQFVRVFAVALVAVFLGASAHPLPASAASGDYSIVDISHSAEAEPFSTRQSIWVQVTAAPGAPTPAGQRAELLYGDGSLLSSTAIGSNNKAGFISLADTAKAGRQEFRVRVGGSESALIVRSIPKKNVFEASTYPQKVPDADVWSWQMPKLAGFTVPPTGEIQVIRGRDEVIATSKLVSGPGTTGVTIADSDMQGHFFHLRYGGDANYNPWKSIPTGIGVSFPVTLKWASTKADFSNGRGTLTVELDAGEATPLLTGAVAIKRSCVFCVTSAPVVVDANGRATATIEAVSFGEETYEAVYDSWNPLFRETEPIRMTMTTEPAPTQVMIKRVAVDARANNVQFDVEVRPQRSVPWSEELDGHVNISLLGGAIDRDTLSATRFRCFAAQACTNTIVAPLNGVGPGAHDVLVEFLGGPAGWASSEALVRIEVPHRVVVNDSLVSPSHEQYRVVTKNGRVQTFGGGNSHGELSATPNQPIVGAAGTVTGNGYHLVAGDGGVFCYGDARFFGSMGGTRLNKPVVGMTSTPSGNGYWLVASDGGIFSFGDAAFFGSMGGRPLNKPIVGMTATPTGNGYWLVASDGGVFAFGDAVFLGSMGGQPLNKPIVGMERSHSGNGYWFVASDGGIFAYGDAKFMGSTGSQKLQAPVVGMKRSPSMLGYWFATADGSVFAYGGAYYSGTAQAPERRDDPVVAIF